jgi:hypothetical protein
MIYRKALDHEKYNIDGAVDYFRGQGLQPGFINGPCRYCKERCLKFQQVDVEERIELRIGAYRIALCDNCAAFQVVYARRSAQKKNKGLFTDGEFRQWSKENFKV